MDDLERIVTVMEEQIALCGTDDEYDRITVYMTADDSKRIVKWLKEYRELRERIKCCLHIMRSRVKEEKLIKKRDSRKATGDGANESQ